jgi:FMN phosphatase YigB (HAD superfamily)
MTARIGAVWFDVGGVLIDETAMFERWAACLKVAFTELMAELRCAMSIDEHHSVIFERLRPGFDVARLRRDHPFCAADLFADVRPCLAALGRAGIGVGVAGNQPDGAVAALEALGLAVDWIGSSHAWGVAKPSPAYFARLIAESGMPAHAIVHVGDRVDNDILPARAAGLRTVFLARGPWGEAHRDRPGAALATHRILSLDQLPARLCAEAPVTSSPLARGRATAILRR